MKTMFLFTLLVLGGCKEQDFLTTYTKNQMKFHIDKSTSIHMFKNFKYGRIAEDDTSILIQGPVEVGSNGIKIAIPAGSTIHYIYVTKPKETP